MVVATGLRLVSTVGVDRSSNQTAMRRYIEEHHMVPETEEKDKTKKSQRDESEDREPVETEPVKKRTRTQPQQKAYVRYQVTHRPPVMDRTKQYQACDIDTEALTGILNWSESQIKSNITEAFDNCDSFLMKTDKGRGYGWSHEPVIRNLMNVHINEDHCTEYYNAQHGLLRQDQLLCAGICSLPFLHTTAATWADEPDSGRNSWALSCLLHVLKTRMMQLQIDTGEDRRGQFMLRLLDLVLDRRHASSLECTKLPGYAVVPLAVMLFDNLAFLVHRFDAAKQEEYFALTTENLNQPIGLADVAQTVLGCSIEQDAQLLAIHNEFESMWSAALHNRSKKYKYNRPITDFPFYGWSAVMSIENALFV